MAGLLRSILRAVLGAGVLSLAIGTAAAQGVRPAGATELQNRYAALRPQLEKNAYGGPIYIESAEGSRSSRGDIYAVLNSPFAAVNAALADPAHWCDVLILHLNTKLCRSGTAGGTTQLDLRIGKKFDQPLVDAPSVVFSWRALPQAADFLNVQLDAQDGPFDTHDYRIMLEAVPLDGGRTFLHLGYSFEYGTASHLALHLYLATIGRSKVGFSTLVARPGAEPELVGGVRGMVERNTMRYYLAIEAYLGALSAPPAQQLDKRLQAWFDATEKFPRQLHELDRTTYLEMKHREYRRQQAGQQ
ncbi:hypothetical protein ACFPOE_21805 [Caenimonas terrae]|uniref:Uncharacterized protein n=1 Tax=Caenimonas terrae TaxID=696074 RepID=A0ABW0NJR1_9BURK